MANEIAATERDSTLLRRVMDAPEHHQPKDVHESLYSALSISSPAVHYLYVLIAVSFISLVAKMLSPLCGPIDVGLLYLLPVLFGAVVSGLGPSLFACFLGVLAFDYFFLPPLLSLTPTNLQNYFFLAIYVIVAVVTGTMAARLRSEREHLRALTSRIEHIREEERTAIAREIHDELGQSLTGIKLDLSQLSKKLPRTETSLVDQIKSLGETVDDTIKTVRRIAADLRPGILDELGLKAAIEWQVEAFANKMGVEYELSLSFDDTGLDRNLSTALFRILQEALTNIARHANATNVYVDVREGGGLVIMSVEDNGAGAERNEIDVRKSLGLLGIRERAGMLKGEAHISIDKKKGTTLFVKIPVTRVKPEND
jgi:signal transduction histidine kinase